MEFVDDNTIDAAVDIAGTPNFVHAQLYDLQHELITPGTDCISLGHQNYSYPFTNLSFTIDVDKEKIETSNLTTFETSHGTGNSVGVIQFYIQVAAKREDNATLVYRRLYVDLSFDLTKFTFGISNTANEDHMHVFNTNFAQFQVQACECDRISFVCIDDPPVIPQNTDLVICLKPTREELRITNFAMQVINQDFTFEYNPVTYGESIWQTNSLTDVTEDLNFGSVMVITPIVAPIYDGQLNILTITGSANLEFHTSRKLSALTPTPFEVNVIIGSTEKTCPGFFHNLLQLLLPQS